jgi:alcohol dehydrogenase YqhD (iron-dependent ADH family)
MLGDFTFHNPCRIHLGQNALDNLPSELAEHGPNVVLVYGGYKKLDADEVREILMASE